MSKAIFCDRCGILFPEHNIHKVELFELLPEKKRDTVSTSRNATTRRRDLCSICFDEVVKFLNGAQEAENEHTD